jgi:6-pyruvoyltetrahydropterin/6-carboxytetrahydropterin synthase
MSSNSSQFEVTVEAGFSAAHHLRGYAGKCANNHGHNFRVRVTVAGPELDPVGMLIDFGVLKGWVRELCERFDHQSINDIPPFTEINPTTENLARYFAEEIARRLPASGPRVSKVWIQETDTNVAVYRPAKSASGPSAD